MPSVVQQGGAVPGALRRQCAITWMRSAPGLSGRCWRGRRCRRSARGSAPMKSGQRRGDRPSRSSSRSPRRGQAFATQPISRNLDMLGGTTFAVFAQLILSGKPESPPVDPANSANRKFA